MSNFDIKIIEIMIIINLKFKVNYKYVYNQ